MPTERSCTIEKIERYNQLAYAITVDAGKIADDALPGQFVHVKCGHSRLLRRPISICDAFDGKLKLVFEVRGEGTEWLSRRAAGDELNILGPLGHGFDVSGKNLVFVGGGIGIPPMLYSAKRCAGKSTALLGYRDMTRAMLSEEFMQVCDNVAVASDDGSVGYHGYVDALLRRTLEGDETVDGVLACGPKPMLKSIAKVAAEFGVPCQVSMEERMGCGVGACLVCACKTADGQYKHACKDGPVFMAEEVDWDE